MSTRKEQIVSPLTQSASIPQNFEVIDSLHIYGLMTVAGKSKNRWRQKKEQVTEELWIDKTTEEEQKPAEVWSRSLLHASLYPGCDP